MKVSRAFTLIELLTVIVILAVIAALIFPVLTGAVKKSKSTPCTSNLRQIGTAWSLYRSANNDTWPDHIQEFYDPSSKEVFACPLDSTSKGANVPVSNSLDERVSYFYVFPEKDFRNMMYDADPNAGIAYCVLHGSKEVGLTQISEARLDTRGTVLRLGRDLSVTTASVGHLCMPGGLRTRSDWMLLSDADCPPPFCPDGSYPCD